MGKLKTSPITKYQLYLFLLPSLTSKETSEKLLISIKGSISCVQSHVCDIYQMCVDNMNDMYIYKVRKYIILNL